MENIELVKEAFNKVKQDINFLNEDLLNIKITLNNMNNLIQGLVNSQKRIQTDISTLQHINKTENVNKTHNSTVPHEIEGLKPKNLDISIGNRGVSTDRQTDKQTDTSTHNFSKNKENEGVKTIEKNLQDASNILNSLDSLKKEIRLKFKHLTPQEMAVFSTIYQFDDQGYDEITYKTISKTLKLSESSIRDYVQRMISKGIPINKIKFNNKTIFLSISQKLKDIAPLSTLIQLREL